MSSQTPLPVAKNKLRVTETPKCDTRNMGKGQSRRYEPRDWHAVVFGRFPESEREK